MLAADLETELAIVEWQRSIVPPFGFNRDGLPNDPVV